MLVLSFVVDLGFVSYLNIVISDVTETLALACPPSDLYTALGERLRQATDKDGGYGILGELANVGSCYLCSCWSTH